MKSRILILLAFIVVFGTFSVSAQPDSSFSKVTYFNSIHVGGLLGKKGNGSSLTASLIQGVRYKNFSFGIGIGYDAYRDWRTLPLFGSVSYDFARIRNNAFFIQLNAGLSKVWNPLEDDDQFVLDDKAGRFIHPLVGYRIQSQKFSLYMTAGYKLQHLAYEHRLRWLTWGYAANKVTIEQDIERLSVQLGFGFR